MLGRGALVGKSLAKFKNEQETKELTGKSPIKSEIL